MTLATICFALALLSCGSVDSDVNSQDVWGRLQRKIGWVSLGDVDAVSKRWVTTTPHRIVGAPASAQSAIPAIGDILTFEKPVDLIILDYGLSAELRQLEAPVERALRSTDYVGELPAGSRVLVEEVRFNRSVKGPQDVCIRVTPATRGNRQ